LKGVHNFANTIKGAFQVIRRICIAKESSSQRNADSNNGTHNRAQCAEAAKQLRKLLTKSDRRCCACADLSCEVTDLKGGVLDRATASIENACLCGCLSAQRLLCSTGTARTLRQSVEVACTLIAQTVKAFLCVVGGFLYANQFAFGLIGSALNARAIKF